MKLLSDDCDWKTVDEMSTLVQVKVWGDMQEANTWGNVNSGLCHNIAWLGHIELTKIYIVILVLWSQCHRRNLEWYEKMTGNKLQWNTTKGSNIIPGKYNICIFWNWYFNQKLSLVPRSYWFCLSCLHGTWNNCTSVLYMIMLSLISVTCLKIPFKNSVNACYYECRITWMW